LSQLHTPPLLTRMRSIAHMLCSLLPNRKRRVGIKESAILTSAVTIFKAIVGQARQVVPHEVTSLLSQTLILCSNQGLREHLRGVRASYGYRDSGLGPMVLNHRPLSLNKSRHALPRKP
jgi:hypothetical protein